MGAVEAKSRGKILVVDDEEPVARLLELWLREEGYQVRLASAFDQVCARMAAERFDLVTLDIMMPGVGGLQILRWLREHHPETGVVMATALGEMEVVIEAMRKGAYSYLLKPFKLELVAHELARAMERQRLEAENRSYQLQLEQKVAEQTGQLERRLAELKRSEEGLAASQAQLRALFLHLQSAREEERKHVAREIHDELGQALTALKMDVAWLQRQLADQAPQAKFSAMLELIDNTVRKVQQLSAALRPGLLDDLGLRAALEWQAEEFSQRTDLPCALVFHPEEIALDPERSLALFRVFQEALTNVYRHARASRVWVRLEVKGGWAALEVRDNGRGITPQESASPRALGIVGMQERIGAWGGKLEIEGQAQRGTTLVVRLPLAPAGGRGDD